MSENDTKQLRTGALYIRVSTADQAELSRTHRNVSFWIMPKRITLSYPMILFTWKVFPAAGPRRGLSFKR